MRKLTTLVIFCMLGFYAYANPLPAPAPILYINEFAFDDEGKWVIELYGYDHNRVDSLFIISSSGRAKLKKLEFPTYSFELIRNDSLLSNLFINPDGDSIGIEYHFYGYGAYPDYEQQGPTNSTSEAIIFGNYKNSTLPTPKTGQSITEYLGVYGLNNNVTIGNYNDNSGITMATLEGVMYNEDNSPFTNYIWYNFYGKGITSFRVKEDGTYSTRIVAGKRIIREINYNEGDVNYSPFYRVEILPIDVNAESDIVINADIHMRKRVRLSINALNTDDIITLKISPNPIQNGFFEYETTIPIKSTESFIEITNLNGQKIAEYPITDAKGILKLSTVLSSGTYLATLRVNKKNYTTVKIIVPN